MSPTGATSKGSLLNLYLLNWHSNVVKNENFYPFLYCDTLKHHQIWSCSVHLLVWIVYCLMLATCVLAMLVPGQALLNPSTAVLFFWVLGLWQCCCTIWLFHLLLVTPGSAIIVAFLSLFKWLLECICYLTWWHLVQLCAFEVSYTCEHIA